MEIKDIISSGLLELYITGAASKEEALQVQQWAEQYPEVKKEIEDLQDVMENYAMSQAIQPDASVKEKIFSRIQSTGREHVSDIRRQTERQPAKVYSIPAYYKWAVAASIILLIGSLILNYTFYNKYQNTSRELQTAQNELQKQQQVANAMKGENDVVRNKYAVDVVMKGTDKAPDAVAKIFWVKNTGDVWVDATNLPETPAGMQYQLWAIVDGKPVDAGMITTEKGVFHFQKMKSFGKAQAFAITLEKAGGSPTPTLDQMIVQAKI